MKIIKLKAINKIAIACFKKDMPLVRVCVSSIRYWYPHVEIYLIKDLIDGQFSTIELEKYYDVKILGSEMKNFGWPWSKLSILFQEKKERWLFLDSDTVILGKVLDKLMQYDEDFVVTGVKIEDPYHDIVIRDYIDTKQIKEIDPEYSYPGYGFNGGQILMTSGILTKYDYSRFVDFNPPMSNRFPKIFKHGDQGIMNYVFRKAEQDGKATVHYDDFWIWPGIAKANEIQLDDIENKVGIPFVLHWAGIKPVDFRRYKRYDIFSFYENEYYKRIPFGKFKQLFRYLKRLSIVYLKIAKYKILNKKYEK